MYLDQMNERELGYALSKQMPAMCENVTLQCSYGEVTLRDRDARRIAALYDTLLCRNLRALQRQQERT